MNLDFGALRSLLSTPSPAAFDRIVDLIEPLEAEHRPDVMRYLEENLSAWPSRASPPRRGADTASNSSSHGTGRSYARSRTATAPIGPRHWTDGGESLASWTPARYAALVDHDLWSRLDAFVIERSNSEDTQALATAALTRRARPALVFSVRDPTPSELASELDAAGVERSTRTRHHDCLWSAALGRKG